MNTQMQISDGINRPHRCDLPHASAIETENTILSIMILTRNRKDELLRALKSCIECSLPPKTEFIIVDNASEDGTRAAVGNFFQNNSFEYYYHYLSENVGAAAGRNEGFKRVKGRYVYFMDDDAYIDGPKQFFFQKMINYLKQNIDIFAVTTSIYDTRLQGKRLPISAKETFPEHYKKVLWFHCGSVLVDKQRGICKEKLFLRHIFLGMEELYPSLKSYFNGKYIVEMDNIQVIHEPSTHTRPDKRADAVYHYTGGLHTKLIFYPLIAYPFLYTLFCLRIVKHLGIEGLPEAFIKLSQLNKYLRRETVPLRKFITFVRDFGFIATF